jgi:WD40 repeat protein
MFRAIMLSLCISLLLFQGSPATPPAVQPTPLKDGLPAQGRLDLYGDPLPKHALVRIGTTRLRQPDTFVSVAFAADGRTLASVCRFGQVCLWDATTGRLTEQVDMRNARAGLPWNLRDNLKAEQVAFSCDGTRLAILALGVGQGRIWIRAPKPQDSVLLCPPDGHEPRAVAFSPDNRKLAEICGDILSLWDIEKRQIDRRFRDPGHTPRLVAFSPDGKQVASGGDGIRLWDVETGKLVGSLSGHDNGVYGLAFSPDGKTLVSAGRDNALRYWDVARLCQVRSVSADSTFVFACSLDRRVLATSRTGEKIQLWEAQEGKLLREISNEGSVNCFVFSPDGKRLLAAGGRRALRLWDVQTGKDVLPFEAHLDEVNAVAFSPDGQTLATSAWHAVRLWDSLTGRGVPRLELGDFFGIHGPYGNYYPAATLAFTPDGKHLAAMDRAGSARGAVIFRTHVWNVVSGKKCVTFQDPRFQVPAFAVAPDSDTFAIPARGGTQLQSLSTQKQIRFLASNDTIRMGGGNEQRLLSDGRVAFSPDGRTLACTGLNGIRLRDWQKGTLLRTISGEWASGGFIVFSPDGKLLAACQDGRSWGFDTKVHFWEVATGTRAFAIDARDGLNGVAFSPDGRLLATAPFKDKTIRVWSIHSGKQVAAFEGHDGPICSVAFSPDGKRLASGSTDTTALIWSLEGIAAPLPTTDPDAKALGELWAALAAPKADKAYPALWSLAGAGDKAVRFLAARVSPATEIVDKRIAELLAALESNDFPTREAAAKEVVRLGQAVVPALRHALEGKPSAEMHKRLQSLLEDIGTGAPPPEALRQTRAVQVLEQIGSPQACEVLETLATGAADADLTRDARAALRRLEHRAAKPGPGRP